jgi:AraC-like DNA-binding protein
VTTGLRSALLHFTTDAFRPGDRAAAWHETYGRTIAKIDLEPPAGDDFMISASLRDLPGLGLVSMTSTELCFHKTRSLIDNDDVVLTIIDSGHSAGSQLGREARLEAGDAVLSANGEVGTGLSFGRRVLLRIPREAIAPAVSDLGARVLRRIPRETEALRMLRQYLRAMLDLHFATPDLQQLTVAHVYDLVALTLGATRDAAGVAEERGVRAARLRGIKEDVARNLAGGEMSETAIAARQRVSPRYLRKLFENEGVTFTQFVLDQRLALAHRFLSDPQRANDKIASIAFAAGFGDVSYFYRTFRRRYDLLPTDVRAQARASTEIFAEAGASTRVRLRQPDALYAGRAPRRALQS